MTATVSAEDLIQQYFAHFAQHADAAPTQALATMAEVIGARCLGTGTLYVFGNGACAALAAHMATDLGKGTAVDLNADARTVSTGRLRVVSLTDNAALLTAYGNDLQFREVFTQQLRNLLRPEDTVLALSGSGASPNVLSALDYAGAIGAYRLGMTGQMPRATELVTRVELAVQAPATVIDQIEDWHVIYNHVLARLLRIRLARWHAQTHTHPS